MILIIAYGNSLRRDDGAGLALGEILERALRSRGRQVKRIAQHQLDPESSLCVAEEGVSSVVFVDTRVAVGSDEACSLQVMQVPRKSTESRLGHHLGPSAVMAYARLLYGKDPIAWVLTVPGVDFDHGEGFSGVAQEALKSLPTFLESLPHGWPETEVFPASDS
jgi:hydrogenase maturation protease